MSSISIFGLEISVYALLCTAAVLIGCAIMARVGSGTGKGSGRLFGAGLWCALWGLFFGRGLYCILQADRIFYDAMGRFAGIGPFFDLTKGSVSVMGVLLGVFLASLSASRFLKTDASVFLDRAVRTGLFVFAFIRFVEPLSGQGYGPLISSPVFSRVPFAINGWDGWSLSVSFIEGILLAIVGILAVRIKWRRAGNTFLFAAVMMALSQIIPESLRQDDALRVFVFARVNQLGYAFIWTACAVKLWQRSLKEGVSKGTVIAQILVDAAGIGILVIGEFALDKTEFPKAAVYGVMALALIAIGVMLIRALKREDIKA